MSSDTKTDQFIEQIADVMREQGMRMTKPRERILRELFEASKPQSAEEIRQNAGFAPSDLVTVYRNLESMLSLGRVQRIILENGTQLFEWVDAEQHHHHIICRHCHHTEPIDFCAANELESIAQNAGFSEINHVIEVFGTCKSCDNKTSSETK